MNKFKLILIAAVLVFLMMAACSRGLRVVREVSTNLYDEDVLELTDKNMVEKIVSHKSQLVFLTLDGKIYRWNPEEKIINFLYNLNKEIDPDTLPHDQGDFMLIKLKSQGTDPGSSGSGDYVVFDLDQMKETAFLQNLDAKKIVGLDRQLLFYVTSTNELAVLDYLANKPLAQLTLGKTRDVAGKEAAGEEGGEEVFNSQFKGNSVYILSGNRFHIYDRGRNTFSGSPLKYKAASPFLMEDKWIYYGSQERQLIKLSIRSQKASWKFKIADQLRIKPQKIGPYVCIIPEDNNIYFFNRAGSLYWWKKLNSTRRVLPVSMDENIVVLLWNNKIKFFNYKKKRVVTYPMQEWMEVKSNPVYFGDYLYVVAEDKLEENVDEDQSNRRIYKRLSRVGNYYGVKVKTDPDYIWPKGKSIKFTLKGVNLIKPQYTVKILKESGNLSAAPSPPVFEKVIARDEIPSFVWIPEDAAKYQLVIDIEAENQKGLTIEETYNAVDVEKMLQNYYYEIQRQSGYSGESKKPKRSKKSKNQ
ncbi:MAG: hypothetical protein GY940_16690 [bacterium]|nr:hypothetical protein [bacterium]